MSFQYHKGMNISVQSTRGSQSWAEGWESVETGPPGPWGCLPCVSLSSWPCVRMATATTCLTPALPLASDSDLCSPPQWEGGLAVAESRWEIIVHEARPGVLAPPCWLLELAEPVRSDLLTLPEPYLGLASQAFSLCQCGVQPAFMGRDPLCRHHGQTWIFLLGTRWTLLTHFCWSLGKGPETKGDA